MTRPAAGWGARLALGWADLLTRTAPRSERTDRLAEITSDVYEQVVAEGTVAGPVMSRRIAGRALRGMPADLAWRTQLETRPGRLTWHLDHPGTLIGASLVFLVPFSQFGSDRTGAGWWAVDAALCWATLAFAVLAVGWRFRRRWDASGRDGLPLGPLARSRRSAVIGLGIGWAGASVSHHDPQSVLDPFSSAAWGLFGISLLAYLALVLVSLATALQRSRANPLTLGR